MEAVGRVPHGSLRKRDRNKAVARAFEVNWKNKGSEFKEGRGRR